MTASVPVTATPKQLRAHLENLRNSAGWIVNLCDAALEALAAERVADARNISGGTKDRALAIASQVVRLLAGFGITVEVRRAR